MSDDEVLKKDDEVLKGEDELLSEGAGAPPVPWHFKLMVGLAALYVGWRVVQLLGWLGRWILDRL